MSPLLLVMKTSTEFVGFSDGYQDLKRQSKDGLNYSSRQTEMLRLRES